MTGVADTFDIGARVRFWMAVSFAAGFAVAVYLRS